MRPRLIGGEMLLWSDLDGIRGPAPVGGTALPRLLSAVTGRTLVVGPHEPSLVDAIPTGDVTVLVRGLADAEALSARYAQRPGRSVWCGSLEKLAATPAYDTVVALDGFGRVFSAETVDLSWQDTLNLLLAVLRPQGRLLLGMENLAGLHRLVMLPREPGDGEWTTADEYDDTRPAGASQLRHRLERAGLDVIGHYAAFPAPGTPTALFGGDILTDPRVGGFLAATVGSAGSPAGPVLADAGRLASRVARHGLAAELAPGWVVVARRPSDGPAEPTPEAVVAGGAEVHEVHRDAAGRWIRRAVDTGEAETLPLGPTLEDRLLSASLRHDLPTLRGLLMSWQAGPAAGVPADRIVAGDGERWHALAPAQEPAAALRRFAATVIEGGLSYLWPAPADEIELTSLIAAMAGRQFDAAQLAATVPQATRPDVQAVRELTMTRDRLLRELAEARAEREWYEQALTARETALKRAHRLNAVLSATVPGRAAIGALRMVRGSGRFLRATVRRRDPGRQP